MPITHPGGWTGTELPARAGTIARPTGPGWRFGDVPAGCCATFAVSV